jgi:hypothetical protein
MGFHQWQMQKKQEKKACREFEVFCGTAASQRAPRALSE